MRKSLIVFSFPVLTLFGACGNTSKTTAKSATTASKEVKGADCAADVICTEIFAMVTVNVKGSDGQPAKLDDIYTVRTATGEKIRFEKVIGDAGMYTVLDDGYQKKMPNTTAEFRFIGIKGGKEVVSELYTISADCCHVKKMSGKKEIYIQ